MDHVQTTSISSTTENPAIDPDYAQELLYLRALMDIPGLGCASLSKLLKAADLPELLWNASDSFLATHLSEARRRAFLKRRDEGVSRQQTDRWLNDCLSRGVFPLACTHASYSSSLREIAQPPPILYVRGNILALAAERTLAIVGTRKASTYGRRATQSLMAQLAPSGVSIMSGLAADIDTEAHRAALHWGLPTVAVFGCGLDIIFPAQNASLASNIVEQGGAIISEYEFGVSPSRATFPRRNRIVAGLSQGVVVIEGDQRSGAMITANLALEEGRTVFALPGSIFESGSQGPLALLKNGAVPVSCGDDILLDLGWQDVLKTVVDRQRAPSVTNVIEGAMMSKVPQRDASSDERASVLETLSPAERLLLEKTSDIPVLIEVLQQDLHWSSSQLSEVLTLLELEGLIHQLPGALICRSSV